MKNILWLLLIAIQFSGSIPIQVQWTTFDPAYAYDVGSICIIQNVYDGLIQYKNNILQPMISENVPSVRDKTIINGTTYIFHIRKNIYFHSGNKLTPEDVKYSFMRELLIGYKNGQQWILYSAIFGVNSYEELFYKVTHINYKDCVENNTFKLEYLLSFYKFYDYIDKHFEIKGNDFIIHLDKPNSTFLSTIQHPASWAMVIDSKIVSKYDWNGKKGGQVNLHLQSNNTWLSKHFAGCGPYEIKNVSDKKIDLIQFKNYYREQPYLKQQSIVIDYDVNSRYNNFIKDNYILLQPYTSSLSLYKQHTTDYYIIEKQPVSNRGILFAWNVTPDKNVIYSGKWGDGLPSDAFSDMNLRKAFLSMFPFYSVNSMYWNGQEVQTPGAIPDGFPYFDISVPMWRHRDTYIATEYFKKAYNGIVWEKGFKFTVYYFKGSKVLQLILEQYAEKLHNLNPKFHMIVKGLTWNEYMKYLFNNKLVIIASGWVADYYDPYDFVYPYMQSTGIYGSQLGKDYIKFQQENIDPLLQKILQTTDKEQIQAYYNMLIAFNYYFQLGVYIQSPVYIVIHNEYFYTANSLYSGVYLYAIRPRN